MNNMTRLLIIPALILTLANLPTSVMAEDDGVYRVIDVTSSAQCTAACKSDKTCRGWSMSQPDTRHPNAKCSLNNGLGEDSPFKADSPDPVDKSTVLVDMNAYRAEHGLGPLTWNDKLTAGSQTHSDDLAAHGILSHDGTDGSTPSDRAQRAGYSYRMIAENVASGQKTWPEVLQAWKDSPGHNKNLLNSKATEIGVSLTHEPKTLYINYWAMLLGAPLQSE